MSSKTCEFIYSNTGRRCICDTEFEVTPIDGGIEWGICQLHLGFFLIKRSRVLHTVKRIVPWEKPADGS